jgi:hypothetical protein
MRLIAYTSAAALCAGMSFAGASVEPPPSKVIGASSVTDTQAFAGINWVFGSGQSRAEGVLGVMRSKVYSDGDARALQGSVHVNLTGGLGFGKARIAALNGKNDGMAMIGLGFGSSGAFGTAGFWAPHLTGGVDGNFGGGMEAFVGLHSLGKLDKPVAQQEQIDN